MRTERQGLAGVELAEHLEELATTYNTVAMANVQANGDLAQELLRKAEMLTEQKELMCNRDVRVKLRAVTLNNMGCLYRRCATSALAAPLGGGAHVGVSATGAASCTPPSSSWRKQ